MLNWLHVKNLALVRDAEMDFAPGFNAVTGETGAGKSVLMGALKLLFGARFDKSAIRSGAERCEIAGSFSVSPEALPAVQELLEAAGVEPCENASLLIKRVFTPSSGKIFVNASAANSKLIAQLGEILADIHGASETSTLTKPAEQLAVLDRFAGHTGEHSLLEECAGKWREYTAAVEKKRLMLENMPSALEAEHLAADVEKIAAVNVQPGEDQELSRKHAFAANAREILEITGNAANALTENEDSVFERIAAVRRMIQSLERVDPEGTSRFLEVLENISDSVRNLSAELADHASSVELDENEFAALEERMHDIQSLKRRFGPEIEDILKYYADARKKLSVYENSDCARAQADAAEAAAAEAHLQSCRRLSDSRKAAAEKLSPLLRKELAKLGFKRSAFEIVFQKAKPGPGGADKIEFMFSANPGTELLPLRDTASSGELCRVMLAIKTVLAGADRIPTLVFDEIDANIGGETAVTVAAELKKLAETKQILSISHLPRVAAVAERHFVVSKHTTDSFAETLVEPVAGKKRVQELARMLGGGEAAENHAAAMLQSL